MKMDFENSIRKLSFLCRLLDIKIAWINPRYIHTYICIESMLEKEYNRIQAFKCNLKKYRQATQV